MTGAKWGESFLKSGLPLEHRSGAAEQLDTADGAWQSQRRR